MAEYQTGRGDDQTQQSLDKTGEPPKLENANMPEDFRKDAAQEELPGGIVRGLSSFDTVLYLSGVQGVNRLPRYLKSLSRLQKVDLSNTDITDPVLAHLKTLPRLETLRLSSTQITDAGLKYIGEMTGLTELDLSQTRITDQGLVHLKNLPRLTILKLSETGITDAGLKHIGEMTGLKELDLWWTRITDDGLVELKKLTELNRIRPTGKGVSLSGLFHLRDHEKLSQVDWFEEIRLSHCDLDGAKAPWTKPILEKLEAEEEFWNEFDEKYPPELLWI